VGKLSWFKSLTELNLASCGDTVSGVTVELQSMPCLRSLSLPSSCAERAVDAEAVCAITTLTTLLCYVEQDQYGNPVDEAGEWVLDLSRLTTLDIKGVQPDGQASAGAEQPHCPHHPQSRRLQQRDGRGTACSEQSHRPHHLQPLAASELC
jgi:hypothetical protein